MLRQCFRNPSPFGAKHASRAFPMEAGSVSDLLRQVKQTTCLDGPRRLAVLTLKTATSLAVTSFAVARLPPAVYDRLEKIAPPPETAEARPWVEGGQPTKRWVASLTKAAEEEDPARPEETSHETEVEMSRADVDTVH